MTDDTQKIIEIYKNSENPQMKAYAQKLEEYLAGNAVVHKRRDPEAVRRHPTRVSAAALRLGIFSRSDLHRLEPRERNAAIAKLAHEHHFREIQKGHVINNQKTEAYAHHPIAEIDAFLFNTKCEPYNPTNLVLPDSQSQVNSTVDLVRL